MRPCLLLFLVLLGINVDTVRAQSSRIDSLKAGLAAHPQADTGRVNRLNALSRAVQNSDPALNERAAKEALALAQRLGYVVGQAQAYLTLGLCSVTNNDLSRALSFTQNAQRLYAQLGNRQEQITCFTQLSAINIGAGNYTQALAYGMNALNLADRLHDQAQKATISYMLSQTYALLGDYEKAWAYARTGLQLCRSANNSAGISQGTSTLGEISRMQGKWQLARQYYQQSLTVDRLQEDPFNEAITEGNIADVSEHEGHYTESLRYGRKVLAYYKSVHADGYLPWIQSVLARAYLHTEQLDSAIVYGLRSQVGAQQGGQPLYSRDAAEVLAKAYARRGDFTRAYRQQTHYMTLKDSLTGEETIRRTASMQYTYNLERKQAQIALLTQNRRIEAERTMYQQRWLYASLGGILLLLGLSVVLVRINRARLGANAELHRQKQIIETSLTEEIFQQRQQLLVSQLKAQQDELRATQAQLRLQQEKERIARDLHDHVGAQLSVIAANANTPNGEQASLMGDYAREAMQSLRDTVWAIDQSAITLADFRSKLQQYLNRQQQQHPSCTYTLTMTAPTNPELTSAQALNLFRQVQEAVHNAFKHARATAVTVVCTLLGNELQLSITDNGLGFDSTQTIDNHSHYGLRNLQRRADELRGTCRIESEPGQGTCVSVTIPLAG